MIEPDTLIDGRYRVLSRLGSGGMADVYLAQDQLLGREVAVKVLHHHFAEDQEFVERFRREASSAAGLSHPNIVGIFDRGEWNGTYYIAMEYVAGRSLKTIVREGALDPYTATGIVMQILRAARFAHRRGVIHRDLKPHNVLLDEEGRARVTDFGIARAGASDMTMTGSIMGTAQYLSPEQAQGHSVTEPSDLYSIGVILYELLTGVVPFEGETAVAIAFKQVSAEPRPPSELNPAIPASLDAVVMRALAKDPASRFADADQFIAALEAEQARLPTHAALAQAAGAAAGAAAPTRAVPAAVLETAPPATGPLRIAPAAAPQQPLADGRPGRAARIALWALGAVLLAGAIAVAVILLIPNTPSVFVPDVRGQSEQAAGNTLRDAHLIPVTSLEVSSVQTGLVISQLPSPGSTVAKGSKVSIVISEGPRSAPMTSVTGLTTAAAKAKLIAAGFKPVVKTQSSATVPAGRVIATEPAAETETHLGAHVTLLVSSGPAPVKVPDVVGETLAAAEATLKSNGLAVGAVTRRSSSTEPAGTVLSQSPANGSLLHEGGKVALTVAQASKEATVPNVVGQSEALAAAALGEAGFKPKTVTATATVPAQEGEVLAQAPSAGTRARKGSVVTIGVGVLSSTTTTTPTTTTPTTTTPTSTTPSSSSPAAP